MANLILGLDPGTHRTGYGLVEVRGGEARHVAHGVIELGAHLSLPERLLLLAGELDGLYRAHPVTETSVEKIFFGKNADSAFKLGHARGVCLMVAARHKSQVHEYAARFVKKCVTGSGAASKNQVQAVITALLAIPGEPAAFDASDALALAVTHSREAETRERIRRAMQMNA